MMGKYKKIAIVSGSVVAAVAIVFGVLAVVKPGHKLPVDEPNSSVSSKPLELEGSDTVGDITVGEGSTTAPETTVTTTTTKAPTTTKKPTTTTKRPTTTTKAPTKPVKDDTIQIDSGTRRTPEELIAFAGVTMDKYREDIKATSEYKCEWCGMHNCKSITYYIDTNGDAYSYRIDRSKCPVWSSEEHKCPYCGKILTDDWRVQETDENKYCLSSTCRFSVG